MPLRIAARYFKRIQGEINSHDLGPRQGMGNGNSDCTRAGPNINDAWVRIAAETRDHGFHQMLGFGTRDQYIRRDFEEQTKELLLAGNVLHWLTCQPAPEQSLELFCLPG